MQFFSIDLHIHSVLSPCGADEMTPPNIIRKAKEIGLQALVIADHNSCENQEAFWECARSAGISYLPGIEVQTREDVHILCVFDTLEQSLACQEIVYAGLPNVENKEEIFGPQKIVDAQGNLIRENKRLLLASTNITVDMLVAEIKKIGGLALPAHIDRPAFSLWTNLGFIPDNLEFAGVELTPHLPRVKEQIEFLKKRGLGVVLSSDAHYLSQIGGPYTWAYIEEFSVKELQMALKREEGRYLAYASGKDPFLLV